MSKASKRVSHDITAIATMSLAELRAEWERRYGAPPRHRAGDLIRRVLAWRIQADVHGGLDASIRRAAKRFGLEAVLEATGQTFAEVAAERLGLELGDEEAGND